MKKINIAIDGYAACGKSSTAKAVAKELAYLYIDSGAMYRAFSFFLLQQKIPIDNASEVTNAIKYADIGFIFDAQKAQNLTTLNGNVVEHEIRTLEVSSIVSEVSAYREVRHWLVAQQRSLGANKGVVMDGRDVGTVVFPDAELKIFMTASLDARIVRRKAESLALGYNLTEEMIKENLLHRDYLDANRTESPLKKAPDAFILDTTDLTFQEQVNQILHYTNALLQDTPFKYGSKPELTKVN